MPTINDFLLGGSLDQPSSNDDFTPLLSSLRSEYPRIGKHLENWRIQWGPPQGDDRQLETYPPNESWNPNPGYWTTELYRRDASPDELKNLIAGDSMHYFGGVDPESKQPNDPVFHRLKEELIASRTPNQQRMDQEAFNFNSQQEYGKGMPFDDFLRNSRADEYIMGYLFPDKADEWRKGDFYTPQQISILEQMRSHLKQQEEQGTTIQDFLLARPVQELRTAPAVSGYVEEPRAEEPGVLAKYGPSALRLAGTPAGYVVGAAFGAPQIGGASGAGLGEAGAQALEYATGQRSRFNLPAIGVATAAGAVNPAPLPSMAENAAREALINMGVNAASQYADSGQVDPQQLLIAGGAGAAGGAFAARQPAARARALDQADQTIAQFRARPESPTVEDFILGEPAPRETPTLLDAHGRSLAAPTSAPELITPGPQPNPQARIVSPSGEPFPADSAGVVRTTLERRGIPQNEIDRILSETAPPVKPGPELVTVEDFLMGKPRTYGGDVLAREEQQGLTEGIQAALRQGPPESGPTVLPFRKGEEEGFRSPFTDSVRAASAKDTEPASDFWQVNNQRGAALNPVVSGLARAGVGGAIGYTQGDTEDERLRNAAIGAGVAAGGPVLISQILKRARGAGGEEATLPPSPTQQLISKIGDVARKVEAAGVSSDFDLAHQVADGAWKEIETLAKRVHEVSPDNRLFRLVDNVLFPSGGAASEQNLATVSGAGRLLQRYSALAQALSQRAATGDKEAEAARKTLFGADDKNLPLKLANLWRGSLTGRVATAGRNFADQAASMGTLAQDKLMVGVLRGQPLEGFRDARTIGEVAGRRFLHPMGEDPIAPVLAQFPEQTQRLLQKPEGLEKAVADLPGPIQKTLKGAETYVQIANKLNDMQEGYFRKSVFEAELRNSLRKAGVNANDAFSNPGTIPANLVEDATNKAMRTTFAAQSTSSLGRDITTFFSKHPALYAFAPFPRYIENRLNWLYEHSPLGLMSFAANANTRSKMNALIEKNTPFLEKGGPEAEKAAFNIQKAQKQIDALKPGSEIAAKAINGTVIMPLIAGLTLRNDSLAGSHWYTIKDPTGAMGPDAEIDMRSVGSVAYPMFLAEVAKELIRDGSVTMPTEDIWQGIAIGGLRAGVGFTLLNKITGTGGDSFDSIVNTAADLAGSIPSGFFNPISQGKDIAAAFGSKEEATQREFRDTPLMRVYGPTLNNIPGAERYLPEKYSPTSAGPVTNEFPIARFMGVSATTPNPVEKEISRLGIGPQSLYPREKDKATVRDILRGQGRFVENVGSPIVSTPGFQQMPEPLKAMTIKRILGNGRKFGLAGLPPEEIRKVLLDRKPQEVRDLLGVE